jgi:hypothetical protein
VRELKVWCPTCLQECGVDLDEGDLAENSTTEGFLSMCDKCGCHFRFDVYVDVMNMEKIE